MVIMIDDYFIVIEQHQNTSTRHYITYTTTYLFVILSLQFAKIHKTKNTQSNYSLYQPKIIYYLMLNAIIKSARHIF